MSCPQCSSGTKFRYAAGSSSALFPAIAAALVPKCPLCFAGYAAVWSALGLSVPDPWIVRVALLTLSIVALGYLVHLVAKTVRSA